MNITTRIAPFALSFFAAASALASEGYVTANVNLRAGPDSGYPSVARLHAGTQVVIEGCVDGWAWCDVSDGDDRGWVAGNYLREEYEGQRVLLRDYGVRIGIPIVSFQFDTYWGDHYHNRSWYGKREQWSHVGPQYRTDQHATSHGDRRDESHDYSHSDTRSSVHVGDQSGRAPAHMDDPAHRSGATQAAVQSQPATRPDHHTPRSDERVSSGRSETGQTAHVTAHPVVHAQPVQQVQPVQLAQPVQPVQRAQPRVIAEHAAPAAHAPKNDAAAKPAQERGKNNDKENGKQNTEAGHQDPKS